jgi:hypothetical protein
MERGGGFFTSNKTWQVFNTAVRKEAHSIEILSTFAVIGSVFLNFRSYTTQT